MAKIFGTPARNPRPFLKLLPLYDSSIWKLYWGVGPERGLKFSPPRKVEASPEVPRHILLVGQESPASNTCSRPRASFAHAGYE